MGPLDGVHGPEDVEEMPAKRRRIDLDELDWEEDYEEQQVDRSEELVISKDQRVALRRPHAMVGRCSKRGSNPHVEGIGM